MEARPCKSRLIEKKFYLYLKHNGKSLKGTRERRLGKSDIRFSNYLAAKWTQDWIEGGQDECRQTAAVTFAVV